MKQGKKQYKTHTRLTKRGWALLIFSAIGILVGRVFGLFEIIILCICSFTLPFLAFSVKSYLKKITIECRLDSLRVECYESANIQFRFQSPKRNFLKFELQVQNITKDSEMPELILNSNNYTFDSSIDTQKRGLIEIGPLELVASDPFTLVSSKKSSSAKASLLVYPAMFPLSIPKTALSSSSSLNSVFNTQGTEFHSLKDYQAGDDISHIHWRSSAKTGNLVIQQFESNNFNSSNLDIFLDTRSGVSNEVFENMVSAVASVVNSCEQAGGTIHLQTTCNQKVSTNKYAVLDFLSQVQQMEDSTTQELPLLTNFSSQPDSDLTLAFLGKLRSEDELQLNRVRRFSTNLQLLFFDDQFTTHHPSIAIPLQESFQTAWETLNR